MLKTLATSALLVATIVVPAGAQTSGDKPSPQMTTPSAPDVSHTVTPGNENASPTKSDTTGAAGSAGDSATPRPLDSSGNQGMPGTTSGPPVPPRPDK